MSPSGRKNQTPQHHFGKRAALKHWDLRCGGSIFCGSQGLNILSITVGTPPNNHGFLLFKLAVSFENDLGFTRTMCTKLQSGIPTGASTPGIWFLDGSVFWDVAEMMFFVCQTFLVVFPKYFIFGVACNLSSPVPIRSTPAHLFGKNQDLSAYSDPSLAGFILRHIFSLWRVCMIQLLVRRCTSLLVLASMWRPEIHVTRKWFKEVGPTSWRVSSDWFKGSKSRGNEVFVALNIGGFL